MQEAIENYRSLLQIIWPMDQTGNIIGRLLLRYWYISAAQDPKTKIEVICSYFNAVQRRNVKRAANKGVVLDFEEHEKILKETLAAAGLRSEVPYEGAGRSTTRYEAPRSHPGNNFKIPKTNKSRMSLVNGLRLCYEYNNGKCTKKTTSTGCENNKGEKFAHNCNVYNKDKQAPCHGKHPRSAHKP